MAAENYVNLYFDDEKIRLTILTNLCRMLVKRGYMDINKYKSKKIDENKEMYVSNDHIDNSLFLPFIEKYVDNNTYVIELDNPYRDQREDKAESKIDFDGLSVVVKIITQTVKDISNSTLLNDFFKTYSKHHKIIIFDGMADKVYNLLSKKKNVEVFDRDFLMIDLMSHVCAPLSCEFVTKEDINYIINPKLEKIHENDPLVRYYNGKKGQILRTKRASLNNSVETAYKKIIDARFVFK